MKKSLNLIIVDDDKVQRYAIKRQLLCDQYKFNIWEADCGKSALQILSQHIIDCIIVDYVLPEYDGLNFIHQVRNKFGHCPPFLFITSFGTEEVVRSAFKNGCFDYISKTKLHTKELLTAVLALADHARNQAEITDKIENIELLAAEVTHDLCSPLRSMNYSISQLDSMHSLSNTDHAQDHIMNIKSNIFNIKNILNDITNSYANKENNFRPTKIDFNELISEVVESILYAYPNKSIQFSYKNLPILRGDKNGLFRIFYNLVSNGIKYNEKEIISIDVYHEETVNFDKIIIQDNGLGIPHRNIKDIFEPFYQVDKLKKASGTGLGLAICRKIIDQHNGKIFVESKEGQGSKFKVALPRYCNI